MSDCISKILNEQCISKFLKQLIVYGKQQNHTAFIMKAMIVDFCNVTIVDKFIKIVTLTG